MVWGPVSDVTLRALQGSAAGLHLAQAVYGETLVNTLFAQKSRFPLTNPVLTDQHVVGYYDLAQLAPVFSLLSAANHLWAVSDFSGYLHWVDQAGYNPARWLEYSVSAGLMWYMVAVLSGVADIKTLVLLVLTNVALQYTGYSSEKETALALRSTQPAVLYDSAQRQQTLGFLLFVAQMVCVWTAFATSVTTSEDDVPWLVWLIMVVITALFLAFGLLSLAYTRSVRGAAWLSERDFRKIEVGYLILSFVAKTFLMNAVLFGAVNRPVPSSLPSSG